MQTPVCLLEFLLGQYCSSDDKEIMLPGQRHEKVLIPSASMMDFATVPAYLMGAFQLIPYSSVEDTVFKALGVE